MSQDHIRVELPAEAPKEPFSPGAGLAYSRSEAEAAASIPMALISETTSAIR